MRIDSREGARVDTAAEYNGEEKDGKEEKEEEDDDKDEPAADAIVLPLPPLLSLVDKLKAEEPLVLVFPPPSAPAPAPLDTGP
ncbi:hypothetical protein FRC20_002829 [Serendipita sp. 405]|nr:hypothetical protein FRC15_002645 [Serendipita sp. 397]KAG8847019.1 hypothetical protein FRC20_002829 [Serendipita sp. 405]